jgi:hypothetical protein
VKRCEAIIKCEEPLPTEQDILNHIELGIQGVGKHVKIDKVRTDINAKLSAAQDWRKTVI